MITLLLQDGSIYKTDCLTLEQVIRAIHDGMVLRITSGSYKSQGRFNQINHTLYLNPQHIVAFS